MTVHFKQDKPDNSNRLDGMKQGVVGKSLPRIEGLAKVTGTAPYAAERHDVAANQAYGWIVGSATTTATAW